MFVLKILFFALISFSNLFALELSVEVTVPVNSGLDIKSQNAKIKSVGKDKIIREFLISKNLDPNNYFSKLQDKKMSLEEYENYLDKFFSNVSLVRYGAGNVENNSSTNLGVKGIVTGNLDIEKISENYSDVIYNVELVSHQNFYLNLNIELLGNTKWEDLGVMGESSFSPVVVTTWRDHFLKNVTGFENILEENEEYKQILDFNPKKINPNSVEMKMEVSFKKTFENKNTNRIGFDVNAHTVLLNSNSREVIYSYNYNLIKKEISASNRKDLSSAMATLIFNLIKSQTPNVVESIKNKTTAKEMQYTLTGQRLFSDVTLVKDTLENYLKDQKITVVIKSLGLGSTVLTFKVDAAKEATLAKKLGEMGKLSLLQASNEQKFLVFNATNNSFAIVSNN